jgi:uncharacterized protein (UPF0248 family)
MEILGYQGIYGNNLETLSGYGGGTGFETTPSPKESIPFQHTQGVKTEGVTEVRKSKLDTPHIKKKVVQQLAVGESQRSIAKDVGIDHSQISRFSKREDIRSFIEKEQMKLVEVVPDAVENVKELVREMKKIPKKDIKRLELSYKANLDTLKSVGIMPSQVQSQLITTIYQQNNLVPSPAVMEILRKHGELIHNFINLEEEAEKDKTP